MINRKAFLTKAIKEGFKNKVSGYPLTLKHSKVRKLLDYKIYGNSVQAGTPTPDNPVEVQSVGERTKNLFYIPDITGTTPSTTIQCNITKPFTVSCQEYPSLIANNNGVETSIWRFQIKYLDGTLTHIMDNTLKGVIDYGSTIKATEENPVVEITYRGIYIREGKYSKFLVEYGNAITEYEPYGYKIPIKLTNENEEPVITNIYLDEPLRKIGDYADYIDFETGKVVRNIGSHNFDGSESWVLTGDTSTNYQGFAVASKNYNVKIGTFACMSDRFPYSSTNKANICQIKNGSYGMRIIASSDIVPNLTTSEFEQWLSNNNTMILYPLETPTEETIELPTIPTHKGTNIITVDTTIEPSKIEATYSSFEKEV